jgi:NDP-sugar pyrophosphorylase family protein
VVSDDDGRLVRFQEKPTWGEVLTDTINTGIYGIEPSVLDLGSVIPPEIYQVVAEVLAYVYRANAAAGRQPATSSR